MAVVRIHSEILNDDLLVVDEKKDLAAALRRAKKEGLVLYTPHEINQLAKAEGDEDLIKGIHQTKKEFDARIERIGGNDGRQGQEDGSSKARA
jgi:GTP cyclohydrolase II